MLSYGEHLIVYALEGAEFIAAEVGLSAAAGVAPFDLRSPAGLTGNVLYITGTDADAIQIETLVGAYSHDRRKLVHAFEIVVGVSGLQAKIDRYKPALIVRDLSSGFAASAYQTGNIWGERREWLDGARKLATDTGAAVLTTTAVAPEYAWLPLQIPGRPPRHGKRPKPWDLAQFGSVIAFYNEDVFWLGEPGDRIELTRRESEQVRGLYFIVVAPRFEDASIRDARRQSELSEERIRLSDLARRR